MYQHVSRKTRLRTSTALVAAFTVLGTGALAQTAETEPENFFTMLGRLVFGAGSERVAIDVPQAVTVLDQTDIETEQPATVGDVLERIPGVTAVGSESRWGESFNIRGIGGGGSADEPRIIMQIDGVGKYYEQYRMGSLFAEPEFLKRVEVLRGPSSSTLYGSGAIAGVISMETLDATDVLTDPDDNFAVRQRLQLGDNGNARQSTTVLAFAPNERFEALLGVSARESDTVQGGRGQLLNGTEGASRGLLAKGTYRFGNELAHSIEASYLHDHSFVNDQPYNLVDATTTWGTVDRDIKDRTLAVLYNFDPVGNDLIDLDVQLSHARSAVDMEDAQGTFIPPADYAYDTTTLKIENSAEWSGDGYENYLTLGVSYAKQDRQAELISGGAGFSYHPEGTAKTTSIYAQNELILNDRFTVIAGLRADRQDMSPGPLVPGATNTSDTGYAANLALHYQMNDNWAVFGSASYTERLPVLDEIYDTRPTSGGATDPALGTLRAETSRNFEIGASFSRDQVFGDNDAISFKGLIFNNNMSDQIARNNTGIPVDGITPTYINLDKTRIRGIELEASYDSERLFGALAYTHLDGKNIGNPASSNPGLENQLPADSLSLTLGTRVPHRNLEFGWSMTAAVDHTYQGSSGAVFTPGYAVHDIYALWQPQRGMLAEVDVRLGVSNLFDADYRTNLMSTGTRRAGRTVNLTLTKTF